MGDLADNLRRRVQRSRQLLEAAREAGEEYEIDVYTAELDDLLRRAADHGISIDPASETPSVSAADVGRSSRGFGR